MQVYAQTLVRVITPVQAQTLVRVTPPVQVYAYTSATDTLVFVSRTDCKMIARSYREQNADLAAIETKCVAPARSIVCGQTPRETITVQRSIQKMWLWEGGREGK